MYYKTIERNLTITFELWYIFAPTCNAILCTCDDYHSFLLQRYQSIKASNNYQQHIIMKTLKKCEQRDDIYTINISVMNRNHTHTIYIRQK